MHYIEIQTLEGGLLEWVTIAGDTDEKRLLEWGDRLKMANQDLPVNLRITEGLHGEVVGSWQRD